MKPYLFAALFLTCSLAVADPPFRYRGLDNEIHEIPDDAPVSVYDAEILSLQRQITSVGESPPTVRGHTDGGRGSETLADEVANEAMRDGVHDHRRDIDKYRRNAQILTPTPQLTVAIARRVQEQTEVAYRRARDEAARYLALADKAPGDPKQYDSPKRRLLDEAAPWEREQDRLMDILHGPLDPDKDALPRRLGGMVELTRALEIFPSVFGTTVRDIYLNTARNFAGDGVRVRHLSPAFLAAMEAEIRENESLRGKVLLTFAPEVSEGDRRYHGKDPRAVALMKAALETATPDQRRYLDTLLTAPCFAWGEAAGTAAN